MIEFHEGNGDILFKGFTGTLMVRALYSFRLVRHSPSVMARWSQRSPTLRLVDRRGKTST